MRQRGYVRLVQLLRLFRALQNFQVLNISTYAQLQHELIVFYKITKIVRAL